LLTKKQALAEKEGDDDDQDGKKQKKGEGKFAGHG